MHYSVNIKLLLFLLLHLQHMEVPGPGIESEPQLWQHWILGAELLCLPAFICHKCPILINLFLAHRFVSRWIHLRGDVKNWKLSESRHRARASISKPWGLGVPVVAQWKRIRLGTMRLWVWSLAWLSGLTIRGCHELWCRLQTRLGSWVAVALV